MRIHVTYTGGTIGMIETPHGLAPGADMRGWLDHVLEGTQVTREQVTFAELSPLIDSSNATPENWQAIIDDILAGMQDSDTPRHVEPDRVEAIHYAMDNARPGDVIILAGKGHEDYQEINHVHYPMDERVIVADYLK